MAKEKSVNQLNSQAIHSFFFSSEEGAQKKIMLEFIFEMALNFIDAHADINIDPEYYKSATIKFRSLYELVNALEDPGEPSKP